ncbi:hypothetical protein QT971_15555 [Microcoleus sp. herbarium19]|uniref:hypothetical protein n=1 Tax=unclassified Microcoleus TaxID=2642155 RepID=UPI002FD60A89
MRTLSLSFVSKQSGHSRAISLQLIWRYLHRKCDRSGRYTPQATIILWQGNGIAVSIIALIALRMKQFYVDLRNRQVLHYF